MSIGLPQRTAKFQDILVDTDRWDYLVPRQDDVFVCTPPKCGTTWTQAICALLIFQTPDLPVKPAVISPWWDMKLIPVEDNVKMVEAQTHRRYFKTHTPLNAIPYYPQCTYLVVLRDFRDVFFSMRNHAHNMTADFARENMTDDIHADFRRWAEEGLQEGADRFSLATLVNFYQTYKNFEDLPNIHLFHYADMKRDLKGAMAAMASALNIQIADGLMDQLVAAADFANMKKKADQFAPGAGMNFWKDESRFFNKGKSDQWSDVLTAEDLAVYDREIRLLLPEADIHWLENGSRA